MPYLSAPGVAKHYLRGAAFRLGAADPTAVRGVSNALEESFTLPLGDPGYLERPPLRPNFAEERSGQLNFALAPLGLHASPRDRADAATRSMEDIVGTYFGHDARRWLDGRSEPVRHGRSMRWGAELGTSFDRNGVREPALASPANGAQIAQMQGGPRQSESRERRALCVRCQCPRTESAHAHAGCARTPGAACPRRGARLRHSARAP
jgi:hypothetical protein